MSEKWNDRIGNNSRWLLFGILGVLLLLNRRFALNIAYILFGIGLMLAGVACIYSWWQSRNQASNDLISPIGGLVLFVVGLWILNNPSSFDGILNVIIGLVLIVSGANWLSKSGHPNQDRLMIVLSIVSIVAGLIIALSRAGTAWIATACGFSLIYTAITGFLGERMFHG